MNVNQLVARYPNRVRASTSPQGIFGTLMEDRIAARNDAGNNWTILEQLDEEWSIRKPDGPEAVVSDRPGAVLPCYQFGAADVAVATGNVFARFEESADAKDHAVDLAAAGFEIQRTVPQQPHTVWLQPHSGHPDDGLRQFEQLAAVPGLVHAELQLLRPRHARSGTGVPGPPTK